MSDRINPMNQGLPGKIAENVNGTAGGRKTGAGGGVAPRQAPLPAADTVELTSSARLLERLEKSFASLPGIDRSRIDAVKSAIESGNYRIDPDGIASALLRTDLQLGK